MYVTKQKVLDQLKLIRFRKNESPSLVLDRLRRGWNYAEATIRMLEEHNGTITFPTIAMLTEDDRITLIADTFCRYNNKAEHANEGALNSMVVKQIRKSQPKTFEALRRCCVKIQTEISSQYAYGTGVTPEHYAPIQLPMFEYVQKSARKLDQELGAYWKGSIPPKKRARTTDSRTCGFCGRKNHTANECHKRKAFLAQTKKRLLAEQNKGKTCHSCRQKGHIARDCTNCTRCGRQNHPKRECRAHFHVDGRDLRTSTSKGNNNHNQETYQGGDRRNPSNPKSQPCVHCGRRGHVPSACWKKHPNKRPPYLGGRRSYTTKNGRQNDASTSNGEQRGQRNHVMLLDRIVDRLNATDPDDDDLRQLVNLRETLHHNQHAQ